MIALFLAFFAFIRGPFLIPLIDLAVNVPPVLLGHLWR